MELDELDYELPGELIAQRPPAERDAGRLLVLEQGDGSVQHGHVVDLPELLSPALWVVNDTRVIPARLHGRKPTGGHVELLLVEPRTEAGTRARSTDARTCERWLALAKGQKRIREGTSLELDDEVHARVEQHLQDGIEITLEAVEGVREAIARLGEMPLPPYITRAADEADRARYQTVFADQPGAVAAPTAGLHLSERMLHSLEHAGHRIARVSLHVGPGTFRPVQTDRLDAHAMEAERYEVPEATAEAVMQARREGRPVVAVGTTVVRTLETVAHPDSTVASGAGRTSLFIYPPYRFGVVDHLMTNFHLPRSTLLALVMAFGGVEPVRAAYAEAVRARYRFYSYGDAMLVRGEAR